MCVFLHVCAVWARSHAHACSGGGPKAFHRPHKHTPGASTPKVSLALPLSHPPAPLRRALSRSMLRQEHSCGWRFPVRRACAPARMVHGREFLPSRRGPFPKTGWAYLELRKCQHGPRDEAHPEIRKTGNEHRYQRPCPEENPN